MMSLRPFAPVRLEFLPCVHAQRFAALALTALITGCASVTVAGPDGALTCHGLLATQVQAPVSRLITVSTRGLGVVQADDGLSVGWVNSTRVYAPDVADKCRVVLMPERPKELQQFIKVLKQAGIEMASICIAQTGETQ